MKCFPWSKVLPHPQKYPESTLILNSNLNIPSSGILIILVATKGQIYGATPVKIEKLS